MREARFAYSPSNSYGDLTGRIPEAKDRSELCPVRLPPLLAVVCGAREREPGSATGLRSSMPPDAGAMPAT